jgi:diamine N-acetyltransferase
MGEPNGKVSLREITQEILNAILALDVSEDQKTLVASNAVSIAQASFSDHAWFRAIYADEEPVGFVMLHIDLEKSIYGVWRFMIDQGHQRKGYGFEAMKQVIEYVRSLPKARELLISYAPTKGNAAPFYERCGFVETGEWADGERVMKLQL